MVHNPSQLGSKSVNRLASANIENGFGGNKEDEKHVK